jgi:hypothetical protein
MRIRDAIMAVTALCSPVVAQAGVTTQGDFRVEYTGNSIGKYATIDTAVENWMSANAVHSAQFAFRRNGRLVLSHAYTMGASSPLVTTDNVFALPASAKWL